jgi:hypothetical protein
MQDNLQDVQTSGESQENVVTQPSQSDILKSQMDMAFYEQMSPAEREALSQPQPETDGGSIKGATEQQSAPAGAFDEAKYVKDNFGFNTVDEAKAALQELQTLKAQPQTAAEIKFANDQSKKIYEALLSGETKKVKEYLELHHATESMEAMTPEQQIKMHIKHQYPTLSQQMIDRQFSKMYSVKEEADYDDPIDFAIEKEMAQQKIINDAAAARNYFNEYRNKIELPQLQPQQTVDADYETWKANNTQADQMYATVTVPAINAIKESDLAAKFSISDANSQMNFDINHVVDPNDLATAKQHALNYGGYIQQQFYNADGTPNTVRLTQAILRDMLFDKYVQTTARQAVNAERKRVISKETPNPQFQREELSNGGQETEFERNMRLAMSIR